MSDLPMLILLVAFALIFISVLLFISLGSQGVARVRIFRLLVELWLSFALIIAIFAYISRLIVTERGRSIAEELFSQLSRWQELTTGQQATIIGGLILAVILFIHMLWSLRALQQRPHRSTGTLED